MHRSLDNTLRDLRQDLKLHLDSQTIELACKQVKHRWRSCRLTPPVLIHWFLLQILHGNTALNHLTLLARRTFTASAYCQARSRLPLAVLQTLLRSLVRSINSDQRIDDQGLWNGHRTLLTDGSSFSMSDNPRFQKMFGQPTGQKPGCGFPVARILALFHAKTGFLLDVKPAPIRSHEMSQVDSIHHWIQPGDILVGDRGVSSYAHLALLLQRKAFGLFRLHQNQIVDFTPNRPHAVRSNQKGLPRSRWVCRLGPDDQLVEWFRPQNRPSWMTRERFEALPKSILVRELRYNITQPGRRTRQITLATTLIDGERYSAESLADLYGMRWRVEQNLRDLKQTMKMDVLKCESVDGVLKELTAYAIVYNLVRLVMCEAARRQQVDPNRISFIDAMRWLLHAEPNADLIRLIVNPARENRFEPRVRKRRPKQFPLMKKPRSELREIMLTKGLNA